ncbi:hypothetical protein DT23_10680 [Thioclava indica]|uniref:Uncharacterized protein n=2 Tax=Thioclava indica TaxID=1353528 RepID=A0A074JYP6_9RHOB|nr:hypothetical protein DT23_10680 [Thioclava indica]
MCIPALMLPHTNVDTAQIIVVVAFFAAALTFFEYVSVYPGLVEFRDAPPFNRIRFLALFLMIFVMSTAIDAQYEPDTFNRFVGALSETVARALDMPYSPVRLFLLALPDYSSPTHIEAVRTAVGTSYFITIIMLVYFVISMRLHNWPLDKGTFNVWVNLPTFDPTAGGDVVERLRRDSWFNVALGFLLPFLIPAGIKLISMNISVITLENPHALIWTVTAWAFLPVSLFMRGIAMGRVATMIEAKRRAQEGGGFAPA